MEFNEKYSEGDIFGDIEVEEDIVTAVVKYLNKNEKAYPQEIIEHISDAEEVSKKTVQNAIRELNRQNKITAAKPFDGKIKLTETQDTNR